MLDALVVLGCRIAPGGRLSPAATRRVERGAHAYHEHQPKLVVMCGGKLWHGVSEAQAMARALVTLGVPDRVLMPETLSQTTAENARYAAPLLHTVAAQRVGVVTCDFHVRRARALFMELGFDVVALPSQGPPGSYRHRGWLWLRERAALAHHRLHRWGHPR